MSNYPDNFSQAAFDSRWCDPTEAKEAFDYRKDKTKETIRNAFIALPHQPHIREAIIMTAISNTQNALREWIGDGVSDTERLAINNILAANTENDTDYMDDALSDLFGNYRKEMEEYF